MLLALLLSEGLWDRSVITTPKAHFPQEPELSPELSPPTTNPSQRLSLLPDLSSTPRTQLPSRDVIFFFFTSPQITGAMALRKQATSWPRLHCSGDGARPCRQKRKWHARSLCAQQAPASTCPPPSDPPVLPHKKPLAALNESQQQ